MYSGTPVNTATIGLKKTGRSTEVAARRGSTVIYSNNNNNNNNNNNMFKQDDHFSYKNCYQYGSCIKNK